MAVASTPLSTPQVSADAPAPAPDRPRSLHSVRVEDVALLLGAVASSFCLVFLIYAGLTPQATPAGFAVWWYLTFLLVYWLAVLRTEGRLIARDRLWSTLVVSGATATVVPLVLIIVFVLIQGLGTILAAGAHFFLETVEFCGTLSGASCGGVGHAIVGTLEQVGIAMVISVPLGVMCAVFLNEIGGPLRRPVRLVIDAMSGVPSIVAGLFIYAIWVLTFGFSGFAAALALSILMLPTVTRTSEEVLRLVPDGLREGALALGASEWRTVWSVVLPTARSGLITAVILGVARAVGETAPLILTAFGASVYNVDPFKGPQEALPHFVYQYIRYQPGTPPYLRAWAAAVVLIGLVLALFTLARIIGARSSIEGKQRRARKRAGRKRSDAGASVDLRGVGAR
jgi:phosphate transport system permease protein